MTTASGHSPDEETAPSGPAGLEQLERQVERGSLFNHTALSENAARVSEAESFLYGLIDVLVAGAVIDHAALRDAAATVRNELDARGDTLSPELVLRVDAEASTEDFVPVNCAERLPICHAVCCRLHFALSADEVEAGTVKWDLGQPYRIRHDAGGTCVHNDAATHGCGVYDDRPTVCRKYSCAKDERIWTDFEGMQLNTEWIEQNLHGTGPRLAQATMVRLPDPVIRHDGGSRS